MPQYDVEYKPSPAGVRENNVLWALRKDNYRTHHIHNIHLLGRGDSTCELDRRGLGTRQVSISIYGFVGYRLSEEFHRLREKWKAETAHLSSVTKIVMHPSYQRIIGMGQDVIPLILAELEKEPDLWFWALTAITGDNPISPEQRGQIRGITESWLRWGRERGYLSEQPAD